MNNELIKTTLLWYENRLVGLEYNHESIWSAEESPARNEVTETFVELPTIQSILFSALILKGLQSDRIEKLVDAMQEKVDQLKILQELQISAKDIKLFSCDGDCENCESKDECDDVNAEVDENENLGSEDIENAGDDYTEDGEWDLGPE